MRKFTGQDCCFEEIPKVFKRPYVLRLEKSPERLFSWKNLTWMEKLRIENFKSIEMLELDCKRLNVFIGEPNTGKSNILEALGLLSYCFYGQGKSIGDFVRMEDMTNLFYKREIDRPVKISADDKTLFLRL